MSTMRAKKKFKLEYSSAETIQNLQTNLGQAVKLGNYYSRFNTCPSSVDFLGSTM
jgi:hypothetical protein